MCVVVQDLSMLAEGGVLEARDRLPDVQARAQSGAQVDLYKVLGVQQDASASDVRQAYRYAIALLPRPLLIAIVCL